jgi:hypothetical protein
MSRERRALFLFVEAEGTDTLAAEARVFGRYLVGTEVSTILVDRYVAASRRVFAGVAAPADAAVLAFARQHPWAVGCLDGAAALRRPASLLRSKLLVMSAICEASPEAGAAFLPRVVAVPWLLVRLGVAGTAAVLQAVVGLALLPWVERRAS